MGSLTFKLSDGRTVICEHGAMANELDSTLKALAFERDAAQRAREERDELRTAINDARDSLKRSDAIAAQALTLGRERDEAMSALADAHARAARMEAERDDVIRQWNEARAELHNLRGELDTVTHERDAARAELKAAMEDRAGAKSAQAEPKDGVDYPTRYTATEFEPVVVIEALGPHHHVGAAIKYLARAPHKGRLAEDLRKARWYLLRAVACGVEGKKHPNGRRIAASWCAHYPEKLRESAEDAIDYMLAGDYDRAQLLVLACLDALGGAACTG